nr:Na+/H+ antiporter NhaC family protein [Wolbachia endosymbiont of Cimex lectularius]
MTAFVPLVVFLILYIGGGVYFSLIGTDNPFNQISPVICLLPALFLAVSCSTDKIQHNINTAVEGMGRKTVLVICLIFLFSGAFSAVAKSIGSVDVATDLVVNFFPARLLLPGMFLASAFISTAIGTFMGVVALIVPIAVNLAQNGAFGLEVGTATVVVGAMFGDNLSMISAPTIAAISLQGSSAIDRLKANYKVAFVAGAITFTYLAIISNSPGVIHVSSLDYYSIIKVIPYISLIIMGLFEVNVLIVLATNNADKPSTQ